MSKVLYSSGAVSKVVLEEISKRFVARQGEGQTAPGVDTALASQSTIPAPLTAPKSSKSNTVDVLQHINLSIQDGEFMVLVGPSGCGKSTLLRLIAGLDQPTAGNIWIGDRSVTNLPPKQRDIAMVFQSYALYPHMTVYDNLAFGLRRTPAPHLETGSTNVLQTTFGQVTRILPKGLHYRSPQEIAIEKQVNRVAQMLQLENLLARYPKQLSGGQKQRVALGRAMARNPQVFLMDEPLSNLDAKLRAQTRAQIVQLQRQLGITTIYVTHDQTEAMTMGDRIAILNAGEIQQIATPLEVYQKPANRFVAEFIGSPPMNFVEVTVESENVLAHNSFRISLPEQWGHTLQQYKGSKITLGVRPEHLSISETGAIPSQIVLVEALGHETYLSVRLEKELDPNPLWQVRIPSHFNTTMGEVVQLVIDPTQIHCFESSSGAAIYPL
jgi:multiple sugar transport system ATP-binding protein